MNQSAATTAGWRWQKNEVEGDRKPCFWMQCHNVVAEGSLHIHGNPLRFLMWRMKANKGWLGEE